MSASAAARIPSLARMRSRRAKWSRISCRAAVSLGLGSGNSPNEPPTATTRLALSGIQYRNRIQRNGWE